MAKILLKCVKVHCLFSLFGMINMVKPSVIYGRFKNNSLTASFNDALKNLSLKGNSKNIAQNSSLFDVILTVGYLQTDIIRHRNDDNHVFTDAREIFSGIVRETVWNEKVVRISNGNTKELSFIGLRSDERKLSFHRHMIDEMMRFVDLFLPEQRMVVFTDKSIYGEIALTQILQRSSEKRRKVSMFNMVSEESSDEEISRYLQGDLFVLDCKGKIAAKILELAKHIGYTGYYDSVSWILSQRTVDSLTISCSLPLGRYYGIQVELKVSDAKQALTSVKSCHSIRNDMENLQCCRNKHSIENTIFVQLWTQPGRSLQRVWVPMPVDANIDAIPYPHGNPLWPTIRVTIADTFAPWITVVEFAKTARNIPVCGLHGKYGHRYVNNTSNITIPICAYGLAIDIVRYLEKKHEVLCVIHLSRDGTYGGFNKSTGEATGMVSEITNGNADIAIDMMEDPSRLKVLEFTTPYEVSYHGIAYIQTQQRLETGVFGPFSGVLWLVILSMILGLMFFIWALERLSPYGHVQKDKRRFKESKHTFCIMDSMEYIWGTFCCGEIIGKKPHTLGSRISSIFISFVFIAIVAVYSANLITSFVVFDETPLITGLKDQKILAANSKYSVGCTGGTATANYLKNHPDARVRKMANRLIFFNSVKEGTAAMQDGKIKFLMSDYLSLRHAASIDRKCTLKVIKADSNYGALAISFKKGSPWKRKLNYAAVKLSDSGKSDILFKLWFGSGVCTMSNAFYPLTIYHVNNVFIWASYAACGCLFILLILYGWKGIQQLHSVRKQ